MGSPVSLRRLSRAGLSHTGVDLAQANSNQESINEILSCVVNTYQGSVMLGRVGLIINEFKLGACDPLTGDDWRAACSATIFGLIAAIGDTATFISAAVSQCAKGVNTDALCASDITESTTALSTFGERISSMTITCSRDALSGKKHNKAGEEVGNDQVV